MPRRAWQWQSKCSNVSRNSNPNGSLSVLSAPSALLLKPRDNAIGPQRAQAAIGWVNDRDYFYNSDSNAEAGIGLLLSQSMISGGVFFGTPTPSVTVAHHNQFGSPRSRLSG